MTMNVIGKNRSATAMVKGRSSPARAADRRDRSATTRAPDDRLRRVALAFASFEAWTAIAGQRARESFRVYPTIELRARFAALEASIANDVDAIPPAGLKSLWSVREGIRTELRETTDRDISLGAFFVAEITRLSELLKLYAREAGFKDKELAAKERRGTEKLTA